LHQGFDGRDDHHLLPSQERKKAFYPFLDDLWMRGDFVIGKGFPLGEEEGEDIPFLLKKLEIFKEGFGIPEVRDNDQKRPPYPLSQMG
jgi:hypothetical protein